MQYQTHFDNYNHDNFVFLKDGLSELYKQAVLADSYYFTDPQSSMVKIRLFVELACHELGKHFKLRPPVHGELSNKIKMLQASGCIEAWVTDEMNALRHDGNRSVHMTEVNGAFVAEMKVSRSRMQKNMNSLYEIARYVGQAILGNKQEYSYIWKEPVPCELSSFITSALQGSKDASYYLANKFYSELLEMSKQTGVDRWWQKQQYFDKQADLSYWLEKTHRQGHSQSWLLFAKCYSNKLLKEETGRNAKECFKQALKSDEEGEAAFEFGSHLIRCEEYKLGEGYIHQASAKGNHDALSYLLNKAFRTGHDIEHWLAISLEHRLPESFTADTYIKLEKYEGEQTDESLKALRSALVSGQARQAPGMAFFKSYVELTVYETENVKKSVTVLIDNYKYLPVYLSVELRLFKQISNDVEHYEIMTDIYHEALKQSSDELEKADVKYAIVKQALVKAAEKFKMLEGVNTPKPIPTLLQEAADAGHAEARKYINSTEGKAVLKKTGFTSLGKMKKNAAEKKKTKQKRKLAKKAHRN
ncbi:DUF4145 domain-containing protein [Vibrio lamellibrachiae]|uniref:DUF4145 domain-containing protein n=1 Tax=Vibrio lamellibrachiae TaxID=2910253 RepID=UPI003D14A330